MSDTLKPEDLKKVEINQPKDLIICFVKNAISNMLPYNYELEHYSSSDLSEDSKFIWLRNNDSNIDRKYITLKSFIKLVSPSNSSSTAIKYYDWFIVSKKNSTILLDLQALQGKEASIIEKEIKALIK